MTPVKPNFDTRLLTRLSFQRHLPLGATQQDCDGGVSALSDAGGARLWKACDATKQEHLAIEFAEARAQTLRDAILDLEDARISVDTSRPSIRAQRREPPESILGRLLWVAWIRFRDRGLREMLARGEISA